MNLGFGCTCCHTRIVRSAWLWLDMQDEQNSSDTGNIALLPQRAAAETLRMVPQRFRPRQETGSWWCVSCVSGHLQEDQRLCGTEAVLQGQDDTIECPPGAARGHHPHTAQSCKHHLTGKPSRPAMLANLHSSPTEFQLRHQAGTCTSSCDWLMLSITLSVLTAEARSFQHCTCLVISGLPHALGCYQLGCLSETLASGSSPKPSTCPCTGCQPKRLSLLSRRSVQPPHPAHPPAWVFQHAASCCTHHAV